MNIQRRPWRYIPQGMWRQRQLMHYFSFTMHIAELDLILNKIKSSSAICIVKEK